MDKPSATAVTFPSVWVGKMKGGWGRCRRGAFFGAALSLVILFPLPAESAQITSDTITTEIGETIPLILVSGELLPGDVLRFEDHASQISGRALVVLSSPGGSIDAGMDIGRLIRRRGFASGVFDTCASACALAWLAGRVKYATPEARIGFHVAYIGTEEPQESGMGNALVGLYLGELGMGQNVVKYVTSAPPDGMQWLSFHDAELLGIEVTALPGSGGGSDEPQVSKQPPSSPLPDMTGIIGLDPQNTTRAVANSLARYQEAGISGLEASSRACWDVVADRATLDKVQYCSVLDMVGHVLSEAGASTGFPRSTYFTSEDRLHNVVEGLVAVGVTDPQFAARVEEMWRAQMQTAFAAGAQ